MLMKKSHVLIETKPIQSTSFSTYFGNVCYSIIRIRFPPARVEIVLVIVSPIHRSRHQSKFYLRFN